MADGCEWKKKYSFVIFLVLSHTFDTMTVILLLSLILDNKIQLIINRSLCIQHLFEILFWM